MVTPSCTGSPSAATTNVRPKECSPALRLRLPRLQHRLRGSVHRLLDRVEVQPRVLDARIKPPAGMVAGPNRRAPIESSWHDPHGCRGRQARNWSRLCEAGTSLNVAPAMPRLTSTWLHRRQVMLHREWPTEQD